MSPTPEVFILLVTIFVLSTNSSPNRRIWGGGFVKNRNLFMASIIYDTGKAVGTDSFEHICGGLIFSDYYVVTAAHCIVNFGKFMELVGVDGLQYRHMAAYHKVVEKIPHPDFVLQENVFVFDHDIGLVKTETKIADYDPPIPFNPSFGSLRNTIYLYGWGETRESDNSEDLKQLEVEISTSIGYCEAHPAVQAGRFLCFLVPNQGDSGRPGDSGSPIMVKAERPNERDAALSILSATAHLNGDFYMVEGVNISYYYPWLVSVAR